MYQVADKSEIHIDLNNASTNNFEKHLDEKQLRGNTNVA